MRSVFFLVFVCAASAACGNSDGDAVASAGSSANASTETLDSSTSSFQAEMSGGIERTLDGGAVAGARYGRYHINMSSQTQDGAQQTQPVVVVAFGRTDTSTPAPGTYTVGGRDGFHGTVEVYGSPQREFDITVGELVISRVEGDVISGTFAVTAVERAEEYGAPTTEVRVEGSFRARPAD